MKTRKRQLRNEYRKNHRVAARREIGRTPTWVYREKKDRPLDARDAAA